MTRHHSQHEDTSDLPPRLSSASFPSFCFSSPSSSPSSSRPISKGIKQNMTHMTCCCSLLGLQRCSQKASASLPGIAICPMISCGYVDSTRKHKADVPKGQAQSGIQSIKSHGVPPHLTTRLPLVLLDFVREVMQLSTLPVRCAVPVP